jgi:hypothetical protein
VSFTENHAARIRELESTGSCRVFTIAVVGRAIIALVIPDDSESSPVANPLDLSSGTLPPEVTSVDAPFLTIIDDRPVPLPRRGLRVVKN